LIQTGQGEGEFVTRDNILRDNITLATYRRGVQLNIATGNSILRDNVTLVTGWTGAQVRVTTRDSYAR